MSSSRLSLYTVRTLFDFATFFMLRWGFHAEEAMFRTGWFIESMATQVLVIFVLRTRGSPWKSRPHLGLVAAAGAAVATAAVIPFTSVAAALGFAAPPATLMAAIACTAIAYLVSVEIAKRWFHRAHRRSRVGPVEAKVAG
jgi:P-type Mg2+ transporter